MALRAGSSIAAAAGRAAVSAAVLATLLATVLATLLATVQPTSAAPSATVPETSGGIEGDPHGVVAELPSDVGPHVVWAGDRLFRHSILFDGDSGNALGMVDITWTLGGITPHTSHRRGEVYVIEPVYSRGHRGTRTDYVTIYDAKTLTYVAEIPLPTHAAETGSGIGMSALLDDERFLVILDQLPATSVTVVDLERRRFASDVETAGCSLVYPVGARRFAMLCSDGVVLMVELDDDGRVQRKVRSQKFFDTVADPLSEKGVRDGNRWLFASYEGYLHEVAFSGPVPRAVASWSLLDDSERKASWRVGGTQHLALHRATRRLYSLVHKGGPGTHKDAGTEIWVYDVDRRARIGTIDPPSLMPAFIEPVIGVEAGSFTDRMLHWVLPNLGVHSLAVTQDDHPLLFLRHGEIGAIGVVDALTGEHLRDITEAGIGGGMMTVP
jgi:methylamine dehydrogenase heavy chain